MTAHEAIVDKAKGADRGAGIPDDMTMLRAAVEQTRDISVAKGSIYWPDMLVSDRKSVV